MAFCGLSSVAAAGRMLFAFSRDDGIPGSRWLKVVSTGTARRPTRWPRSSSWPGCSRCSPFIVGTGTAIVIVTAISTIFLYAAYGVCIYLGATTTEWLDPPGLEPRPLVEAGRLRLRSSGSSS